MPYLVLSGADTFWLLLLTLEMCFFSWKKCWTITSHIQISLSYNHLLSNLSSFSYLIVIHLFISNVHLPFNIRICSLVPFLTIKDKCVFISHSHSYSPTSSMESGQLTQCLCKYECGKTVCDWKTPWVQFTVDQVRDLENSCSGANSPFSEGHRYMVWFDYLPLFISRKASAVDTALSFLSGSSLFVETM